MRNSPQWFPLIILIIRGKDIYSIIYIFKKNAVVFNETKVFVKAQNLSMKIKLWIRKENYKEYLYAIVLLKVV